MFDFIQRNTPKIIDNFIVRKIDSDNGYDCYEIYSEVKKVVLAGGVSANSMLRKDMEELCNKNGWELYCPLLKYCGDNAAMVGSQAFYEAQQNTFADLNLNAYATMPIDNCQY